MLTRALLSTKERQPRVEKFYEALREEEFCFGSRDVEELEQHKKWTLVLPCVPSAAPLLLLCFCSPKVVLRVFFPQGSGEKKKEEQSVVSKSQKGSSSTRRGAAAGKHTHLAAMPHQIGDEVEVFDESQGSWLHCHIDEIHEVDAIHVVFQSGEMSWVSWDDVGSGLLREAGTTKMLPEVGGNSKKKKKKKKKTTRKERSDAPVRGDDAMIPCDFKVCRNQST